MKWFNSKFKTVSLTVLLMVIASLAGCTAQDILTLEAADASDQVQSIGEVQPKRFSPTYYLDEQLDGYGAGPFETAQRIAPSYYRDDPALLEGVTSLPSRIIMRISPSYYLDDRAVTEAVAAVPSKVVVRFSPSYHLDDPALIYDTDKGIEIGSSLLAVK